MNEDERTLALAVLHQAIADASTEWRAKRMDNERGGSSISNKQIAEACAFWADAAGDWADARQTWCDAAGIDQAWTRRKALAQIAKARGGCITRFTSWRSRLSSAREKRRDLALQLFAAFCDGSNKAELMARFSVDSAEYAKLHELGRYYLQRKRNSDARPAVHPHRVASASAAGGSGSSADTRAVGSSPTGQLSSAAGAVSDFSS
jgi:hypothetical protein